MNTFKSKIDILLFTPLIFINIFFILLSIKNNTNLTILLFIIIIPNILFAYIILTTYYILIKNNLHIRYAYAIIKIIDISTITEIRYFTKEVRNSYSLSHDRIEIIYANDKSIVISPKDKDGFIEEIQLVNPNVVVTY